MTPKRQLLCEALEKRRLLAANCEPFPADPQPAIVSAEPARVMAEAEQSRSADIVTTNGVPQNLTIADVGQPHLLFGTPDQIQEVGNRLFVIDQEPFSGEGGRLFVFERQDDGSLVTALTVQPGFTVDRMMVVGDQVLMFGTDHNWLPHPLIDHTLRDPNSDADDDRPSDASWTIDPIRPEGPQTLVATVNLVGDDADAGEVIQQRFAGVLSDVHQEDDRLVMILSEDQYVIAVYPPPPFQDRVVLTEITSAGLSEIASRQIESGVTEIRGDMLLSAVTRYPTIYYFAPDGRMVEGEEASSGTGIRAPDPGDTLPFLEPTVVVTQYKLGEESIDEMAELELGDGYIAELNVSDDGTSAYVVRSAVVSDDATKIDLLVLSGETVQPFETVSIPEFDGYPLVSDSDFLLLRDYAHPDSLVSVNTNLSIDLAAENRVSRVELPESLNLLHTHVVLSEGQVVLMANRPIFLPVLDSALEPVVDTVIRPSAVSETVLVTISLPDSAVTDVSDVSGGWAAGSRQLHLIDADSDRFGFVSIGTSDDGVQRAQFEFGQLDDEGRYAFDGSINDDISFWREIDTNPDRLIARGDHRIVEYDWEHPTEPVAVIPLVDPNAPPIEAVSDAYTVVSIEDQTLDVLANDQIPEIHPPSVEIVELVGAPEGTEIVGHTIHVPAAAFEGVDALRFEYVITDGLNTSSAVVEIEVNVVTEDQVRRLVEAVRQRAAEDFSVSIDEVDIVVVERIFDEPLPVVLPDGRPELDLSPGILVTLNVPDATALYAASLEGEIVQVFSTKREILAELGLQAVNDDGVNIDTLTAGQEFWIEFIADDLRQFGSGVYAAFIDLVVPTQHIMLTGDVEYGVGFTKVAGGELNEDGLVDFGALGTDLFGPGGDPQQVLRLRAVAVATGDVTLRPTASDGIGTSTLLHGLSRNIEATQVRYRPLNLTITDQPPSDPMDVDGNGEISANDALRVINFIGTYGSIILANSNARAEAEDGTDTSSDLDMARFDANRDGRVTALDALVIINNLDQPPAAEPPEAEQVVVGIPVFALIEDDDDDDDDEQDAYRVR